MHAPPPPADEPDRRRARVTADAVFDRFAGRVEIGGQILDGRDAPVVGADVVIRSSWGVECSTVSAALGSFGSRMSAPDTTGLVVEIEALGIAHTVDVR